MKSKEQSHTNKPRSRWYVQYKYNEGEGGGGGEGEGDAATKR